jgi:hypothetical protein
MFAFQDLSFFFFVSFAQVSPFQLSFLPQRCPDVGLNRALCRTAVARSLVPHSSLPKGEPVRARQINLATAKDALAAQFFMLNYPRRRAVVSNSAVGANIWDKKYLA